MEFYLERCEAGKDAVCGSCEKCSFPEPNFKQQCIARGRWEAWALEHCCVDDAGKKVACNELTERNIALTLKKNRVVTTATHVHAHVGSL